MKLNYLFPSRYKRVGWLILMPTILFGLLHLFYNLEPDFLQFNVPAIFIDDFTSNKSKFGFVENNIFNEILGFLFILSSLLVAFSKEKNEDEFISKIRLESLVWAVFFNSSILLISNLFIYELSFLWVLIFNMFTLILFFIIRFNWQISKLKKTVLND